MWFELVDGVVLYVSFAVEERDMLRPPFVLFLFLFCPVSKPARRKLQFDPFGTFRVSLESLWRQVATIFGACELLQDVEQKRPREDRRHV